MVLAENLMIEGEAFRTRDSSSAPSRWRSRLIANDRRRPIGCDRGDRRPGIHLRLSARRCALAEGGQEQASASRRRGREEVSYIRTRGGTGADQTPFETVFVLSQVAGDRWLILEERTAVRNRCLGRRCGWRDRWWAGELHRRDPSCGGADGRSLSAGGGSGELRSSSVHRGRRRLGLDTDRSYGNGLELVESESAGTTAQRWLRS